MQNTYVGDIGDFGKYGLLRHLCEDLRLGVVWYLVPDEANTNDGRHVRYLNLDADTGHRYGVTECSPAQKRLHEKEFRACDPELYDVLKALVVDGPRTVGAVADHAVLPAGTLFFSEIVPVIGREAWRERALAHTRDCHVVFLDPDNGLEIKSRPVHSPRARKHALYDEVRASYERGQSIVLYQHWDRTPDLVARCRMELAKRLQCGPELIHGLRYGRGTARVLFVIAAPVHAADIAAKIRAFVAGPWARHFAVV